MDYKNLEENRIEAFKMWFYSWILKIKWTEKVRNVEELKGKFET